KLSSLLDGEANNYKGVRLAKAGDGGILVVPIRYPLPSARGPELATNGRAMRGGDNLILGFIDFVDPACASTASSALQGVFSQ
ncbi:hypothetical protein MTR67_026485, partial [Solanum verrucosum]